MSLTLIHFKIFYLLLILEIILIALNFISTILSIILRLWRSDESVFKKNFSSSSCISCLLLVIIIINLLLSIIEEILYIFFYMLSNPTENTPEIIIKILDKIINNDVEEPNENKFKIFKILPWIAFNFNIFIQILLLILIIILKGRIKLKSHFGFPKKEDNQSTQNKMIVRSKKRRKQPKEILISNGSEVKEFQKKKKKRN